MARHRRRGCGTRTTLIEREKRRMRRCVVRRLVAMDQLAIEGNRQRIKDLSKVVVELSAPADAPAAIGIEVEEVDGSIEVVSVTGLALESGLVQVGYVVVAVVEEAAQADMAFGELAAGQKIALAFRRPMPPIPYHGCARETIHKEPRFVMPREVEEWLRQNAYDHEVGKDKMRPYVACCALKAHFEDCLRNDTGTPVWLELHVVAKWIAEQKKAEKEKRQMMRAAGKAGRSSEKKSKKPAERGTEDEESGDMKESDDSDDTDDDEAGY